MKAKIAIIGAGMAGLSAANHLLANSDAQVEVFEARSRLGGRMHTVTTEKDEILELGAEWIHGCCEANTVFNLAQKCQVLTDKRLYDNYDADEVDGHIFCSGGRVVADDVMKEAKTLYGIILEEAQHFFRDHYSENLIHTTLQEFVDQKCQDRYDLLEDQKSKGFMDQLKEAMNAFQMILVNYIGNDLNQCSIALYGSSDELNGGDAPVPQGLGKLVESLAQPLSSSNLIHFGTKVTKFAIDDHKVTVSFDSGDVRSFDHVISTIPVGVVKANHESLFQPPLPEDKVRALELMGPGSEAKLFLRWERAWWGSKDFVMNLSWLKSGQSSDHWTRGIGFFYSARDTKEILATFVGGEAAKKVDAMETRDILEDVGHLIRDFTGDPTIPNPINLYRHAWTTDPLTLGAWCQPRPGMSVQDLNSLCRPLPTEENPRLTFAGGAFHPQHWSNMHGARLSGLREAQRLIRILSKAS